MSAELAIRAARAEIERDAIKEKYEQLSQSYYALISGDKEKLLDTLTIIGIPARDLVDIYRLEQEWRMAGGNDRLLEQLRFNGFARQLIRVCETMRDCRGVDGLEDHFEEALNDIEALLPSFQVDPPADSNDYPKEQP